MEIYNTTARTRYGHGGNRRLPDPRSATVSEDGDQQDIEPED